MSTTELPTAPAERGVARRDDLVTVATGVWVLAGLVTDLTMWCLRGHRGTPWALRATTAVAAASLTAFHLAGISMKVGIGWGPEFTGGGAFWATALGLGIGTLAAPAPAPT